ncbi:LysR family transcriptional regulator [Pigmentiphaga aceris]|uniref:LysR family transcriptional regulator n=1 Tax=Pigmentiphaga aceris TaxID=1940612 RepID=A0A5C0AXD9_9BURK|nr:LysR family transcriptional regulator [Pigmentiphaga aceris]QEI07142.1 LysR family transcriptional regulator [Pigmentiphaga aceris]
MLRELKTFVAVARYGTFASAGAHIGLTQSAVSAQMQRLEQSLGLVLFERTGRSARLNAQGEATLARAEEIVKLWGGLGDLGQAPESGGKLRIGAITSVQAGPLADALAGFHAASPGCHTRIVPGVSLNLLGMVDSGDVDLAVMIRPPFALPAEVGWEVLAREPFVLLVPAKLAAQDWRELLAEQAFVRYDRTSFGGRLVEQFLRQQRIDVNEVAEIDDQEGLVRLVGCGLGVALVPTPIASCGVWPVDVRAVSLGEHTFYREIGLVQRRDRSRRPAARRLADQIAATFAAARLQGEDVAQRAD